jgi:hypothetical protein
MISQAEIARFHTNTLKRLHRIDSTFLPRYLDICKLLLQTNRLVAGSTFRYVAGKCGVLPPPEMHYTVWHACARELNKGGSKPVRAALDRATRAVNAVVQAAVRGLA